eukprot:scaffold190758_cov25-Tisochrysis_lutea.AAC.1
MRRRPSELTALPWDYFITPKQGPLNMLRFWSWQHGRGPEKDFLVLFVKFDSAGECFYLDKCSAPLIHLLQ